MNEYQNKDEWDEESNGEDLPLLIGEMRGEWRSEAPKKRKGRILITVCVILCTLITALCLTFAFLNSEPEVLPNIEVEEPIEESEEWRGAFSARNIYEKCYQSAVSVRIGRDDEGTYWSGFVIDSDGWIVTSLDMMDASKRGKIYVAFNDGSEYSVDSVWRDIESGIALMKISASSLNAVELRQEDMLGGERVICVGALSYGSICVSSGEICGSLDDSFKVNIGLDASATGAPLFDEAGYLVAMATAEEIENNGKISYALPAEKCKSIVEYIKNEKSQQNH